MEQIVIPGAQVELVMRGDARRIVVCVKGPGGRNIQWRGAVNRRTAGRNMIRETGIVASAIESDGLLFIGGQGQRRSQIGHAARDQAAIEIPRESAPPAILPRLVVRRLRLSRRASKRGYAWGCRSLRRLAAWVRAVEADARCRAVDRAIGADYDIAGWVDAIGAASELVYPARSPGTARSCRR